ncbi:MAG: adenylate/guanylate cyclase domain-containing protein [Candidatus Limnocylindrales bacterium]
MTGERPATPSAIGWEVERRIVTILFADLVGFTSLSERLDAEDVATIQDAYFAAVRETVLRHGGQLEKFIGDAVMAAFGVPRARDDDAERAVRAGLSLVAAVELLGARLDLDGGGLRLRVGVNTGEVVHAIDGPDGGRVTGDPVNVAARLQAAAEPGGVLVGEETALAVAEAIELEAVEPLTLKGKTAPVRAWRVIAPRPRRSRELAMGSLRAPMIGRAAELAELVAAVANVRHRRAPERWLVLAPPGVGKTRLVDEFVEVAATLEPPPLLWRTRLRPEPNGPFDPLRPVTLAALHHGHVTIDHRSAAEEALRAHLGAAGLAEGRAAVVAREMISLAAADTPSEVDTARLSDRAALFAAWLDGFDALAGRRTQIWVIEDLHWAGPDVVAFLDAATISPAGAERLMVATARPSFLETVPAWSVDEPAIGRHVLDLSTLPATDAATLVHALVGDALPETLVARIAERSDGNCLFIEELLRTWVGTGALVAETPRTTSPGGRGSDRWRLTVPAHEIPLPRTVQAIYAAQLDDLPPPVRQAARRGAVAGRRFPFRALDVLGVADPTDAVDELKRRALIGGPHADAVLGDTFAYRHALLRDAGYASLARAERAELHVRLARWLEAAAGAGSGMLAVAIAEHLATGLASAPALAQEVAPGLSRDDCADEAAAWLELAGGQALSDGAGAAAADLFRRSAAVTRAATPGARSRRLNRLGRALAPIGGVEEAARALHEAIDAARAARDAGDPAWRTLFAQATEALASLLYEQIRFAEAWHLGDAALAEMGDGDDLDAARVRLARSRGRSGETNEAAGWVADAERALEAARAAGDSESEWEVTRDLARARSEAGSASLDDWVELRALAHGRGDAALEVTATVMEAGWRMAIAPAEVPGLLGPARELAVARGLVEDLGWIEHAECEAGLAAGEWARALEAGLAAVDLGERHGYDRIAVRSWSALLPAASLRGATATLERAAAWFETRAGRLPDSPYGRMLYAGAHLWLARGGVGRFEAPTLDHLRSAMAQWRIAGSYEWLAAGDAVLDAWFAAGRGDWIREAIEGLEAPAPGDDFRPAALALDLHRARLDGAAAAVGQRDGPVRTVRAIVDGFRGIGLPFWTARGIRVLEGLGAATEEDIFVRAGIESALGAVRATL